jgi:hypothetical protein
MGGNLFADASSSNGEFKFERNMVRLGVGAGILGVLLFASLGIVSGTQEGFSSTGPLGSLIACLVFLGAAIHISRRSGRTLRISDDGICILDKNQNEISNLHWVELARVTERRRMAQLALWDKAGTLRVLVDQQYEKFALVRARVLAEYAKVFALPPPPVEFRNGNPLMLETFVSGIFAAFSGFGAWSTYHQGQFGLTVVLLAFAVLSFGYLLNLHPRIAGPSGLFDDQLVLRNVFKTDTIYRKDISSVELQDMANARSSTKFSFIVLNVRDRKPLRITSTFGSIPELFLTLRAWREQAKP